MLRILIVEDDQAIAEMYKMKSELSGLIVRVASNGKEALDILRDYDPEVVLLDLMMPEMDGNEFLHLFRQNEKHRNTPVIILTNMGTEEAPESLWGLGITDFIIKAHCTPAEVIQKIKTAFESKKTDSVA